MRLGKKKLQNNRTRVDMPQTNQPTNPIFTNAYILICEVKLATVVEGDHKAPFSIATTPSCTGGRYSFPRIASLFHWNVAYIAKC